MSHERKCGELRDRLLVVAMVSCEVFSQYPKTAMMKYKMNVFSYLTHRGIPSESHVQRQYIIDDLAGCKVYVPKCHTIPHDL